jgi:hypothetical protein
LMGNPSVGTALANPCSDLVELRFERFSCHRRRQDYQSRLGSPPFDPVTLIGCSGPIVERKALEGEPACSY